MDLLRERLVRKGDFIGGAFVKPEIVDGYLNAVNPGDRSDVLGRFPFSGPSADEAVEFANRACRRWGRTPLDERAEFVRLFGDRILDRQDWISTLITRETGKPLWEARQEVHATVRMLEGLVEEGPVYLAPRVLDVNARADRVPRGVVCLLVPYSQPFLVGAAHSALALYAGNAVVMKSSKFTPGVGQEIAALWDRCKLPRGVFNMVQGSGSGVGRRLVCHRSVDLLLFTGGFEGAKAVREMTLDRPGLPVIYQCGGKGMAIVLDDADLEGASFEILMGAFLTAGQRHNSTARVLVSDRVHDRFVEGLVERAEQLKIGYGFEPGVFMGPLISERMRSRYQRYGRALVGAGHEPLLPARVEDVGAQRGYYVRPSIVSVDWRVGGPFLNEEPPGPTLLIYKVAGWEEAAALHNQAVYRSVTSVFARADNPILPELRDRLRTGSLNINRGTLATSARLPSVGLGRSGSGTPGGLALLEAFTYWRSSIVDRRGFDPAASLPGMGFGEGSSDPLTDEIDLDTLADVSAALETVES